MVTAGRNLSVWGQWFSCFTTSTNDVCSAHDLAAVNLRCSLGLNESIDHLYLECLDLVSEWSCQLLEFTERNHHHFREDPECFDHSEDVYRAIAMVQFVQEAVRVHYNTTFAEGEYNAFDSRNLFLTGILTGFGGTCVSLPVLYAALAQRIGHPVELAHTWEHYYCVWNSQNGFCFEAAGRGFDKRTHEYYRHFRRIVTAEDERTFGFLRPLSRKELFACFAKERSHCLQEQFRFDEALEADYLAKTIAPHVAQFSMAYALTNYSSRLFRVLGAVPSRSMLADLEHLEKELSSQLVGPDLNHCSSAAIANLRRILRNRYQSTIQCEHDEVLGEYTDFT